MDVAQRHATLKSLLRKRPPADSDAHYFEADRFPSLVANASFPEMRDFRSVAAPVREMSGGKWRWCEVLVILVTIGCLQDEQHYCNFRRSFTVASYRGFVQYFSALM